LLSLNLDKEKLENELRLFHTIRKLDKVTAFNEESLLNVTAGYFGTKFNHKTELIVKEGSLESSLATIKLMPSICWSNVLCGALVLKKQIVHPSLTKFGGVTDMTTAYEQKHKNRKV